LRIQLQCQILVNRVEDLISSELDLPDKREKAVVEEMRSSKATHISRNLQGTT
jgi:hypothetical protein